MATSIKTLFICMLAICSTICMSGCSSENGKDSNSLSQTEACTIIGAKIAGGERCNSLTSHNSSIVKLSFVGQTTTGTCTGTAISSHAVLTAAHCFIGDFEYILVETEKSLQATTGFVIGDVNFSGNLQNQILFSDVAIVFVSDALNLPISPILASRDVVVGEEAVIAGFGETYLGSTAGELYAGKASISDVTDNHILITYRHGQSHPCLGDSGGPLLVSVNGTWAIAGVVSQSDPSVTVDKVCREGDVTLYSNLQKNDITSFILSYVPDAQYK